MIQDYTNIFIDTVKAFFPTHFTMEYPFDPQELTVFALLG